MRENEQSPGMSSVGGQNKVVLSDNPLRNKRADSFFLVLDSIQDLNAY